MRRLTLAVPILALLALPAGAGNTIELVEMKNGRLYEAQELKVKGDRLWIRLAEKRPGEKVAFSVPIDKVVPEFVYHAWAAQIRPDSEKDQLKLAAWARKQGLFELALKTYKAAAALSPKARSELEAFEAKYKAEESAFMYRQARNLFAHPFGWHSIGYRPIRRKTWGIAQGFRRPARCGLAATISRGQGHIPGGTLTMVR